MIAFFSRRVEGYAALRRRILQETQVALEAGLNSKSTIRIPTVEVGRGRFDRQFAEHFWQAVFETQWRSD